MPQQVEGTCLSGPPSEGRARRVRDMTLDYPSCFRGRDKHAPPIARSEGPACQVRWITFDNPSRFGGHDRRAPPTILSEGPACRVRCITFENPFDVAGMTSTPLRLSAKEDGATAAGLAEETDKEVKHPIVVAGFFRHGKAEVERNWCRSHGRDHQPQTKTKGDTVSLIPVSYTHLTLPTIYSV